LDESDVGEKLHYCLPSIKAPVLVGTEPAFDVGLDVDEILLRPDFELFLGKPDLTRRSFEIPLPDEALLSGKHVVHIGSKALEAVDPNAVGVWSLGDVINPFVQIRPLKDGPIANVDLLRWMLRVRFPSNTTG